MNKTANGERMLIGLFRNKKLCLWLALFTVWLYGLWALEELVINPAISSVTDNEYLPVLLRSAVMKNLVWTLPAVLLIRRFSDDMLIGVRELFSFRRSSLRYLLFALPIALIVLGGQLIQKHGISISPSFHPSTLITVLFVGIIEETVFRGLYLNASLKYADTDAKKYIAIGVNALMFLAIHFPIWIINGIFASSFTGFGFITILILSVFFSFCTIKCRNIWVPAILHSFYDLIVFVFV